MTDRDGAVEAVAPVIVSASRRTDIPAFYAEWFVGRLRAGYVTWANPFSGTAQHVSFAKTRAFVFWTKNARPLLPYLSELDQRGIGYYFQFTLNDYEAEGVEPNLPSLAERIETFCDLSGRVGRSRVIWRFDPLLLAEGLSVDRLVERVSRLVERIRPFTEKLVIAFADIGRYAKVRTRLQRFGQGCRELSPDEMRVFAEKLVTVTRAWGLSVATCAEAIDLEDLGVEKNRCIDDRLLARLFPEDAELLCFLGPAEARHRLKDKGQREECGCIVSKDIGAYDTCPHLCRYCYANSSQAAVHAAFSRHRPAGESVS
jgi:hypothetical protein